MFQLIVSIIAVALVAALAGASIFYGGDAFSSGTSKAQATALINEGQQLNGAATLYRVDFGQDITDLTDLTSQNYIGQVPPATESADWAFDSASELFYLDATVGEEVCDKVNEASGNTFADTSDVLPATLLTELDAQAAQYGCLTDTTDRIVAYKL